MIDFTQRFVRYFRVGSENLQVGALYFKLGATVLFNTTAFNTKEEILNELDKLADVPEGDDTNIAAGLESLNTEIFPPGGM